jgi:hypothetical protein
LKLNTFLVDERLYAREGHQARGLEANFWLGESTEINLVFQKRQNPIHIGFWQEKSYLGYYGDGLLAGGKKR